MKKLGLIFFANIFLFTACDNKNEVESGALLSDEAKIIMENTTDEMQSDVLSFTESRGVETISEWITFLGQMEKINGRKGHKKRKLKQLKKLDYYFLYGPLRTVSDLDATRPISFEEIKGLYTWNPEINDFEREESEFFIVRYPTKDSESNNGELQISELEFEGTFAEGRIDDDDHDGDDDDNDYFPQARPTRIVGYLKIDEVKYIEISYDVEWSSDLFPVAVNLDLFVSPFTITIDYTDSDELENMLIATVQREEEVLVDINLTITYESVEKDFPIALVGYVQYKMFKIEGSVDSRNVVEGGNVNDYFQLALFSEGSKLGDIVFEYDNEYGDYIDQVAYLQYEDGSKVTIKSLLDSFSLDFFGSSDKDEG